MIAWNISRVTTSKMMERCSGAKVRPATSQASRATVAKERATSTSLICLGESALSDSTRPTEPVGTSCSWRRCTSRRFTKIKLATPVAAAASTVISPKVSQTRISTRVTLTILRPWPTS